MAREEVAGPTGHVAEESWLVTALISEVVGVRWLVVWRRTSLLRGIRYLAVPFRSRSGPIGLVAQEWEEVAGPTGDVAEESSLGAAIFCLRTGLCGQVAGQMGLVAGQMELVAGQMGLVAGPIERRP